MTTKWESYVTSSGWECRGDNGVVGKGETEREAYDDFRMLMQGYAGDLHTDHADHADDDGVKTGTVQPAGDFVEAGPLASDYPVEAARAIDGIRTGDE